MTLVHYRSFYVGTALQMTKTKYEDNLLSQEKSPLPGFKCVVKGVLKATFVRF